MRSSRKRLIAGVLIVVVGSFVVQKVFFPSDERQIKRTIELVATGSDPRYCDEKVTHAYLEQITGVGPPFADEICKFEAPQPIADSVDIDHVSVDGNRATALVAYTGGLLDGSREVARLVKSDGKWKVDRRLSFAHFDRAGFRRAYAENLETFTSPQGVRCALAREGRLTDAEAERLLLEEDADGLTGIAVDCDREGVEDNIVRALARTAVEARGIRCARRELSVADRDRLIRIQMEPRAYGELIVACDPGAVLDQLERKLAGAEGADPGQTACIVAGARGLTPSQQFRLGYDDERNEALLDRCRDA